LAKILQLDDKVSVDFANDTNNEEYERYIPVEQSIIGSLLEVREMIAGRLPKPTLEDFFAEIDEDIMAVESNERASKNEKRRANAKI